jgi:LmbE family N-acetylglucosaminyl deacetylase
MFKVKFEEKNETPYQILCLGAHSDDIEIGCGGTILKILQAFDNLVIFWVVLSSDNERKKEAFESANTLLKKANSFHVEIYQYKENYFPYIGYEIKSTIDKIKLKISPDIIFTHYRNDLHQDHRLISELTWNAFRDHFILEYEVPKYDGDIGNPNFFVHLNEHLIRTKIHHLLSNFKTQKNRHWFTDDVFLALARLRGIESNAPDNFAEAFHCRKIVF